MRPLTPRGFSIGAVLPSSADPFVFCVLGLVVDPEDGRGPWRMQALEATSVRCSSMEQGDMLLAIADRLHEKYPHAEVRVELECHDVGDPEVERVTRQLRDGVRWVLPLRSVALTDEGGAIARSRARPIVRRDLASRVRMALDGHMLVLGTGEGAEQLREGLVGYTDRLPTSTDEEGRRRRPDDGQFLALSIAIDQAHSMAHAYPGGVEWPLRRLRPDEVDDYLEHAALLKFKADELREHLAALRPPGPVDVLAVLRDNREEAEDLEALHYVVERFETEAQVLKQIADRGLFVQPPVKEPPRVPVHLQRIDRAIGDPYRSASPYGRSLFGRPW